MSFFVTAIAYYPERKEYSQPYRNTHTFGHFPTLEEAQAAVDRNDGEMHECLYNFLVITEVGYGIYAGINCDNDEKQCEWWYLWNNLNWVSMNKPDWSIGTIGWGIG